MTMGFKLEFSTGNAAFEEDFVYEFNTILRHVREAVHFDGRTEGVVRDSNGNKVGEWSLTDDDERLGPKASS